MRDIKFRAWDKLAKRMCQPDPLGPHILPIVLMHQRDFEVLQFTGLHDMKGREIYEGDIVRAYTYIDDEAPELADFTLHEVRWGGDSDGYPAFDLVPNPTDDCNALQLYASVQPEGERIEVIGNVYETPALLTKEATPK